MNPAPVCALRNRQPPSPRPADRFLATFPRLEDRKVESSSASNGRSTKRGPKSNSGAKFKSASVPRSPRISSVVEMSLSHWGRRLDEWKVGGDSTTEKHLFIHRPTRPVQPPPPTESSQLWGHQQTRTTLPLSLTPQKTHKHSPPSDHSPPRIPPLIKQPKPHPRRLQTLLQKSNPPHPHPHLLPLPFPLLPPRKPNRLPIPHRLRIPPQHLPIPRPIIPPPPGSPGVLLLLGSPFSSAHANHLPLAIARYVLACALPASFPRHAASSSTSRFAHAQNSPAADCSIVRTALRAGWCSVMTVRT